MLRITPKKQIKELMTKNYHLKKIRDLLIESFSEIELRDLCFYETDFNPVLNRVSQNAAKDELIRGLIEYTQQQSLFESLLTLAKAHNPVRYEMYQPYTVDEAAPLTINGYALDESLKALIQLMQAPEVREAVVAFQTDFQAACEQIKVLNDYKRLHDLFQGLENRYQLIEYDRRRLPADELAWESLATLHEPEIQTVLGEVLEIAGQASFGADEVWVRQLSQVRAELPGAVDSFDLARLNLATSRLQRVLAREPSRINTLLVAAAGALRLDALVKAMSTVRDSVAQHELEAVRQLESGVESLGNLATRLETLVSRHNVWQTMDDELRRIEAMISYDLLELELTWPDLKIVSQGLSGASQESWAIALKEVEIKLEEALTAKDPVRIRQFFRRYRSQASRRFRQVDYELLTLCQELYKIGESLNLILKVIQ